MRAGTREEWLAARKELLGAEKELTRRSDELARKRRELPWVQVESLRPRTSMSQQKGATERSNR
jgi:predicted dithiol-disulfide oxidoreductase (DUF899 family)